MCAILNEQGVEYLIVGGAAVGLHGYQRLSRDSSGQDTGVVDLDFWYNPSYNNYFQLINALEKMGQDVTAFRAEQTPDPQRSFFRIERPEYTLDFLPELPGLPKFREAFNSKVTTKLDETEILFISFDDLLKNKQALNRPKDQEDIRQSQLKKSGKKEG